LAIVAIICGCSFSALWQAFAYGIEDDAMENGEKAYHAYCPALKGCHTWGRSYDEALANVREAVELYVEDLRESGSRVPI
jgi:predicted RNase H-like HicB family nuclease